jgi:hypothetical protein
MPKLWDSKLGYIMEKYEQQWPMMVYMYKYLTHTSRSRSKSGRPAGKLAEKDLSEHECAGETHQGSEYLVGPVLSLPRLSIIRNRVLQVFDDSDGSAPFDEITTIVPGPVGHAFYEKRERMHVYLIILFATA